MISLFEYLQNNLISICEVKNNGNQYLLNTLDEELDFFKEQFIIKKKTKKTDSDKTTCLQDELNISDESFEELYKYVSEHNLPAPFVANYGNKLHYVAFRRWFNESIQNDLNFTFNKNSRFFKQYHNTSLKEDGKFVPTAQDFEEIISFAYNAKYCKLKEDQNIEIVGINKSKSDKIISYYNTNKTIIDEIIDVLHSKCPSKQGYCKLKNIPGNKITKEWKEKGMYENKTVNGTPKTDIMSVDGKYLLSLKEYGGSQLMSAKINEAKATLLFATEYMKNEDEKNEVLILLSELFTVKDDYKTSESEKEDIFDEFGSKDLNGYTLSQMIKKDKEFAKRVEKSKAKGKYFENQLNELIINKYPEYKYGLFVEAMTGNHKFTQESKCSANFIFVWDDINTSNSKLYTIDEYYKHIEDSAKVTVDFKSWLTSNISGQTLKIITK